MMEQDAYQYDALFLKKVLRIDREGALLYSHHYRTHDLSGRIIDEQLPKKCGIGVYSYDLLTRPKQIETATWKETLAYDAVGNIIEADIKDHDETECHFSYDDLYQLKSEKGIADHTYVSDSLYNCVKKDGIRHDFNALNQLLHQGENNFTYDANGNMVSQVKSGKETRFTYDALDRLTTVTQDNEKAVYTYDAMNRRISKQLSILNDQDWKLAQTRNFIYQGQNEVGACDAAGKIIELRVLGNGKGAEIGAAIALEIGGSIGVPIYDHNGNVVSLLDADSGALLESYRYSAFGEEQIFNQTGDKQENSEFGNPWRFLSKRVDAETGFVYFGRRYYDPSTCRWVSPDPLGFQAGPNLYAYVMNNPLSHIDLYGLIGHGTNQLNFCSWVGKSVQLIGDHLIPIPIFRDLVASIGTVLCRQSRYEEGHSKNFKEGSHRANDKVISTSVNGILNTLKNYKQTVQYISNRLGGEMIYASYNGSHGFISDIAECIAQILNIRTNSVDKLVYDLKAACEEVGPDGQVNHYAHSQGGLITYRALQQLTEQERGKINVTTFGTARIIDAREFGLASAINYINWSDPVPFIADTIGCAKALFSKESCVKFLKSDKLPFTDHSLTPNGTYDREFQTIAKKFKQNNGVH